MANLFLARACSRRCPECFARRVLGGEPDWMSPETFEQALSLLERSGVGEAHLLGGEPTSHPRFVELATRAIERLGKVTVFSHGEMPEDVLAWMDRQPRERLRVTVNVTGRLEGQLPARLIESLLRLGGRARLGLTVSAEVEPLARAVELALNLGLARAIRVGLAHPDATGDNRWLHPRHFGVVAERLGELRREARQAAVALRWDCGTPLCLLCPSPEDESALRAGAQCGPALDILPSGRIVACLPLAELGGSLAIGSQLTTASLRDAFEARLGCYRGVGAFERCSSCPSSRRGACAGGCLALAARRLHRWVPHGIVSPRATPEDGRLA
jgi:MoaA/NifB/PqqE/SkfB family radical SAM enzyme